ncbi:hypothetical protein OV450_0808 [Actinobacteria bacterium OV450]|nr:hypothetical protein OV450_0808 [Actinobacteria bacterium OV450]
MALSLIRPAEAGEVIAPRDVCWITVSALPRACPARAGRPPRLASWPNGSAAPPSAPPDRTGSDRMAPAGAVPGRTRAADCAHLRQRPHPPGVRHVPYHHQRRDGGPAGAGRRSGHRLAGVRGRHHVQLPPRPDLTPAHLRGKGGTRGARGGDPRIRSGRHVSVRLPAHRPGCRARAPVRDLGRRVLQGFQDRPVAPVEPAASGGGRAGRPPGGGRSPSPDHRRGPARGRRRERGRPTGPDRGGSPVSAPARYRPTTTRYA